MTEPLVSVVVPVHDGERFLGDALKSALAQDHPRVEVVVVDDGSSDRSADIAGAFPVRLLRQENQGVAAARNAGIEASGGQLVAFLDQDDVWLPTKLSRQVAALGARPEADFVLTRMEMALEPGVPRPEWVEQEWLEEDQPGVVPSALLARRHVFDQIGAFDTSYRYGCDADWLARAKDAGVAWTTVDEALVRYRIHEGNGNYDRDGVRRELFRVLRASVARQRDAGRQADA
jgi:glycosyltransferase involved in cell wall biosynthesis